MRALLASAALALLAGCSAEPDAPTTAEASAALTDTMRLTWTMTTAPERSPIRVDASGRMIALVASGAPSLKPRSAKPPIVTVSLVAQCKPDGAAVACDTTYAVDSTRQPVQRVRYWRHGGAWRAHLVR